VALLSPTLSQPLTEGLKMKNIKHLKSVFLAALVLTVAACTTVPKDGGINEVQRLVDQQLGAQDESSIISPEKALTTEDIRAILSAPISLKDAQRLSMQLNPMAKANILNVGIAEADYAQAGRMENPGFALERFNSETYSSSFLFDVGGVLLMPLKRSLEARRLDSARYEAAGSVIEHLANTRRAWIDAVAEGQQTRLVERALESAATGNNMTRQMAALGHSGVVEAAESEMFLSEMRSGLAKQKLAADGAKEALIQLLGLWGNQARALTLPDELPPLPATKLEIDSVEAQAIANRIDVQMAKANLEGMAKNLSLTRKNPFLSAIELGAVTEKEEGEKARGYELEFRIPVFDAGGVKNRKAKIIFEQSQAQAQAVAISAASNARSALAAYNANWEIVQHYKDQFLPLRQRISQEQLLMYNGMLISVFDLLDDMRSAVGVEAGYVDAVRDFWLADTNLQQVLTGSGSMAMSFASGSSMPSSGSGGEEH
jgi:outer membrane protein TolC